MGGGFVFIEILIFAMIAAFLVYRLRSVLGRRHGEERQRPNPLARGPNAGPNTPAGRQPGGTQPGGGLNGDNVVHLPGARTPVDAMPEAQMGAEPVTLAEGVRQIRGVDAGFSEKQFVQGARAAFEMIVKAFADGDTATLRPLLADDVYDSFAEAIRTRQGAKETLETVIREVDSIDLIEARLQGRTAFCTVKFVTRQTNVTRNAAGVVVDGDPEQPVEIVDIWTFARNTRARDPNWLLVETRTPN